MSLGILLQNYSPDCVNLRTSSGVSKLDFLTDDMKDAGTIKPTT